MLENYVLILEILLKDSVCLFIVCMNKFCLFFGSVNVGMVDGLISVCNICVIVVLLLFCLLFRVRIG